MNPIHLHLLTNHLPLLGGLLGIAVLLFGMLRNSDGIKQAAFFIFVLCAIGTGITYLAGDYSEELVKRIQGIDKRAIHKHEDAAMSALICMILVGIASLPGLTSVFRKAPVTRGYTYIVLSLALVSAGLAAYTSNIGARIRHPEITQVPALPSSGEEDYED